MNLNKRKENIEIFEDTIEVVKELKVEGHSSTFKYSFGNIINEDHVSKRKEGSISVYPKDTITTALDKGSGRTCVLNMASPRKAGGGVRNGSIAQEECLFRSTNLFQTITQDFYPLKTEDALYTTNAYIVKDFYYNVLDNPMKVDCVTIAALEVRNGKGKNYTEVMKQKIRLMLSLAYHNKVSTLILGAWGCGVFKNDPLEVAQMFKEILVDEEYRYLFDHTIFGIINDRNSVDNNVNIFTNVFK